MIGIDLFSGAGGMSLGARLAGVNVQFCVENDPHALATYTNNHKGSNVFSEDIRKLRAEYFGDTLNRRNEPLVVFGGPPCQGFSTSNQRTRSSENPSNWLFEEFIRVIPGGLLIFEKILFEPLFTVTLALHLTFSIIV